MIAHDTRNPRAVALAARVVERVPELAAEGDLTVVIGGDGFLLQTVHAHGFERCYLGLNAGTLGFLLNDVTDLDAVLTAIAEGDWKEHRFPLLEARVLCADDVTHVGLAMNDVYLERDSGQTARLTVSIDGHCIVDPLSADGLIFATALGSTAYSFSAGGSPCDASLPVLCMTPICPHKPRLSPVVLPYGARASVTVHSPAKRPVRVVIDGKDVAGVRRMDVGPSSAVARIAYLTGHDFTGQMVAKLLT